ncbi:MAG: lipid biosynthesis B12-binding/radical SAM protein [Rikenellaceae bacterium]
MATKIALVSANRHKEPYPVYPLGTAYLKSYLLNNLKECNIDILDLNIISDLDLQEYIKTQMPDYICISIRNVDGANSLDRRGFMPSYKQVIDVVRSTTNVPIIIGGAGFSIFPELFMMELGVDYGIRGEGERALCELISALRDNSDTKNIAQLYTESYSNKKQCNYILSPHSVYEPTLVEYYWKQSGMLNIQTKRGCPYNCIYCTYPQIDGSCVRTMDIETIIGTMTKAKQDFGVNYWFFTDSVFNICNNYNEEFAEALIKSDLNISWGAYFSPSNITNSQMDMFKRSGLTHIEFGTESLCDETLSAYGKRFTFDDVLRSSELALKYNVFYSHFLILAGWGETKKQLLTTIENSKRLEYTVLFPYIGMRIYPNTKLHQYAINDGVIDISDDLIEPKYYITKDFNLEDVKQEAMKTGKAWIFPDTPQDEIVNTLKLKRNKKGPLWEYLRKP